MTERIPKDFREHLDSGTFATAYEWRDPKPGDQEAKDLPVEIKRRDLDL